MTKQRKKRDRLVPPEFEAMPVDKEELARRIAAQRQRLVITKGLVQKRTSDDKEESLRFIGEKREKHFPRSQTMRLVTQKPKLSLIIGVAAVIGIPFLLRRFGAERVWRGVSAASPLMFNYLESQNRSFSEREEGNEDY